MLSPRGTYAVFTGRARYDLELQIIVETPASAKREVRDLKKNYGCDDARYKEFADENSVYAWFEKNR